MRRVLAIDGGGIKGVFPASFLAAVEQTLGDFGSLDIVLANAGIVSTGPLEDVSDDVWQQLIDTNLTGAFFCSQAAYPEMVRAGGGKIINIGSMMSLFGAPYAAPYAASKGGIVQMTRALATSWAKDNIQVNAVLPGPTRTEGVERMFAAAGQPLTPETERKFVTTERPSSILRRLTTPEEIAEVVAFVQAPYSASGGMPVLGEETLTWAGGSWGIDQLPVPGTTDAQSRVSCASQGFCMLVDQNGQAAEWDGTSWLHPSTLTSGGLNWVSCATASLCAAVSETGNAVLWNGSAWTNAGNIDKGHVMTSVSCPTSAFCVAVDTAGYALTYS